MYTDPLHDETVNAVIALLTHSKGADLLEVNEFVRKLGGNKGRCFTRESLFHFCSRENLWLKITDSGDTLWLKMFGKPPGQVPLSAKSRELFTESFIFRHRPEVGRVIFIAD